MIYAIVQNGIVVNTIEWDGVSAWAPPAGTEVHLIPAGVVTGIGATFDGQNFGAPPNPPSGVI